MQLIVVREATDSNGGRGRSLLRYALSTSPLQGAVLDGLCHLWSCHSSLKTAERMGWRSPDESLWILPQAWQAELVAAPGPTVFYSRTGPFDDPPQNGRDSSAWHVITNGRFAAHVNQTLLERCLATAQADCLTVTVAPELGACREKLRLTQERRVVGFRRLYADTLSPVPVPRDWPHLLLVRREAWKLALAGGVLADFDAWVDRCRTAGLKVRGVAVAGSVHDLESEEGVLCVSRVGLRHPRDPEHASGATEETPAEPGPGTSPAPRLIGPVLCGRQVTIEAGAVVAGPTILCDGSTVGRGALVDSAIVGRGVTVAPHETLTGCLVRDPQAAGASPRTARTGSARPEHICGQGSSVFRTWPVFSYARCCKRIADVIAAGFVLTLFAPIIPVIALAVKLSSPGPVFFGHQRQGRHGRSFRCLKFRTMRQGADQIQDKLRFVCEVDGPQFKMADDPRITTVGRFLRETYLDEIPQFLNVLWGQMSVVGPRPSPEAENTLCPSWRDARLSVRPGVTGLWQVQRTREAQKDFQEWILYDTQYVRDFSFGLDLWICWRTFAHMVGNFVRQF